MAGKESALWVAKKRPLLNAVRRHTKGNGQIPWARVVSEVGMSMTACRLKWRELTSEAQANGCTIEELVGRSIPPPSKPDKEFDVDELAPLHVPAPPIRESAKCTTGITVGAGDFHFGPDTYAPECEEILLAVVRDLQPETVVLNGDLPDMLAVSRYPKDYRQRNSLSTEKRQLHEFLYRLIEASPKSKIIETNANHSGDGIESRWSRYLSERVPEIMEDPEIRDRLSYQSVFHPAWAKVDLVDYHTICPGLIAIHGDVVRGHAAYSARGMLEKWRVSLIHGHTHRFGSYCYRVPAVAEKREHQMRAYEGGCMCRLTAPYLSVANWQQGFWIARHSEDGVFGVEQVHIQEGRAVCTTTGNHYKAAA